MVVDLGVGFLFLIFLFGYYIIRAEVPMKFPPLGTKVTLSISLLATLIPLSSISYAQTPGTALRVAPAAPEIVPGARPGSGTGLAPRAVETLPPETTGRPRTGRGAAPSASSSSRGAFSRGQVESAAAPAATARGATSPALGGVASPASPRAATAPAEALTDLSGARTDPAARTSTRSATARTSTRTATARASTRTATARANTAEQRLAEEMLRRMARTPESSPIVRIIDGIDGVAGRTITQTEALATYQARVISELPATAALKIPAQQAIGRITSATRSAPLTSNIPRLTECLQNPILHNHILNILPEVATRMEAAKQSGLTSVQLREQAVDIVTQAQAATTGRNATDPAVRQQAQDLLDDSLCGPLSGLGR